jgi:uncharacterized protein YbjT (DUF2867 family)
MSGSQPQPGRALVFGASGYVGRHLVPRLLAEGVPVRAAARRLEAMEAEGWADAEHVWADALEPASLSAAMQGCEVAYYLVHSMAAGRGFADLDVKAAANFAEAAAATGLRRIVYLGGLVPEGAESPHLVSRRATGEVLRTGPVPVVELRAGIIVGPGSAAFEVMRDLVAHLPVMVTPPWIRSASPPIALDNLLTYLIALSAREGVEGRVFDAGGPESLSYEEMMRRMAPLLGRPKPVLIPVPVLTPELSAYWLQFVTATPHNVARALIMGLRHDIPADDAALRALLPIELMDFETSVRQVLEDEKRLTVGQRWREGALMLRRGRHDVSFYGKRKPVDTLIDAPPGAVWDALHRDHPGWEEIGGQRPTSLVMLSPLHGPGSSGLEFTLTPQGNTTRVQAVLHWHPLGFKGLLAWYLLRPLRLWRLRRALDRAASQARNMALSASSISG